MNNAKIVGGILGSIVVAPIWYYLLFKILKAVSASELMWFLYWVYLPVSLLVRILAELGDD